MSTLKIRIDRGLCDGCGKCITACSEDALAMEGGKAYLITEIVCDGAGDCIPACPTGALSLEVYPRSCPE